MPRLPRLVAALLFALTAAACSVPSPQDLPRPAPGEVAALAQAITDLGPRVDPDEARRMARIAYDYPLQLAVEYQVEDRPIIHNMKVNQGLKPRGLCYQWADDLETRLSAETFQTLELQRAIANSESALRIEHSTVIVTAPGDSIYEGIVLDPWQQRRCAVLGQGARRHPLSVAAAGRGVQAQARPLWRGARAVI